MGPVGLLDIRDHHFDASPLPESSQDIDRKGHRLIAALNDDVRRPIQELAEETGMSIKSVRTRSDRLIDGNMV